MFLLVMKYIRRSRLFHNQHNAYYVLFIPDPAASCVADTPISGLEIYIILCSSCRVCHFSFSHGRVQMGQKEFGSSIFVRFFFFQCNKGYISLITHC